jgi:heptaprenylglyceryl phosphate synthase
MSHTSRHPTCLEYADLVSVVVVVNSQEKYIAVGPGDVGCYEMLRVASTASISMSYVCYGHLINRSNISISNT